MYHSGVEISTAVFEVLSVTQLNLSLSGELPAPISRIYYLASELASVIQVFDWTLVVSATKKNRDSCGLNARQVGS